MSSDDPEWMLPMDRRILELMERSKTVRPSGLWLTPKTIAVNLDATGDYCNRRLREMEGHGYVDNSDGYYRITNKGSEFIRR